MSDRAARLAQALPDIGADLLVVTSLVNVRYLTGFTGSNALALIGPDTRAFVTDFRYLAQSAAEVDGAFDRTIAPQELMEMVPDLVGGGELRLAFEDAHLSVRAHARLRELVPERVELIPGGDAVETLRAIKDADEIRRISEAAKVADAALRQIMEQGLRGRTEVGVAMALERAMEDLGAQRAAFSSIVAAGPHGALPHAQPRDVEIGADELVVIDWGAELDGYCSDCTRTLATGELPDETLETYDLVRQAQLAGLRRRHGGRGRPRDRCGGARGHQPGRARRALRPRSRPRRGPRDPRGPAAVAALGLRALQRQCGHGRARRVPAGPVRGADRGPGRRDRHGMHHPHVGAQRTHHRPLMSRRTDQRRAAVWALYQSDLLGRPLGETLPRDVPTFTFALAEQAREHQPELDELIRRHSNDWPLERIAPVERSILRVALLEMLYPGVVPGEQPIPPEGAIDEAIETAKRFCGSGAPAFINGILGAVLREREALDGRGEPSERVSET